MGRRASMRSESWEKEASPEAAVEETAFDRAIKGRRPSSEAAAADGVEAAAPEAGSASEEEAAEEEDDDEEEEDEDEEEAAARYESARRGFAQDESQAQELVRAKKRREAVAWTDERAGKPKRVASRPTLRQRETCARLHRDAARQARRRDRAREVKDRAEVETLRSGKFKMTGRSKALARHVQPRGRSGATIHERLYSEHDEQREARKRATLTRTKEKAGERDWLCPKCGFANGPKDLVCERVVGFRVSLQDALPSSWAWAGAGQNGGGGSRFGRDDK